MCASHSSNDQNANPRLKQSEHSLQKGQEQLTHETLDHTLALRRQQVVPSGWSVKRATRTATPKALEDTTRIQSKQKRKDAQLASESAKLPNKSSIKVEDPCQRVESRLEDFLNSTLLGGWRTALNQVGGSLIGQWHQ
jgi:hypothetical protein